MQGNIYGFPAGSQKEVYSDIHSDKMKKRTEKTSVHLNEPETYSDKSDNHSEKPPVHSPSVKKTEDNNPFKSSATASRKRGAKSIKHMATLNPLDIPARLNELSKLENGWLNGEGIAPKKEHLLWFSEVFEDNFDTALLLPHLYPTVNGGLQAEWSIAGYEISLNIDLAQKTATYQSVHESTGEVDEVLLDLDRMQDWQTLNHKLARIINRK